MKLLLSLFLFSFSASAIELADYLEQVKTKNLGFVGVQKSIDAKTQRQNETTLLFKPMFFFNGQHMDDKRVTNAPSFQGTQTIRKFYQAGLNQQFKTGTKASFSYNFAYTEINGAQPGILPRSHFYDLAPQIELTQSLWRNFFGLENKAQEEAGLAHMQALKYADQFKYKQLILVAENTFWRLAFAQRALKVQEESFERAKKLRDWSSRRVSQNLTDEIDLLQAEANLQGREIELSNAQIEMELATLAFNNLRQEESKIQVDDQELPGTDSILNWSKPIKGELREDILVSLAQLKAATAQAQLGSEKNKPVLELYGSYSLNGRAAQNSEAYTRSWDNDHPLSVVGVRFVTSLDFATAGDSRESYVKEKVSAKLQHERKLFEVNKEWEELSSKFEEFKKRLKLTIRMEDLQKRKITNEKERFNRGRSTTYQILEFEQDYASAQLLKLHNQFELISLYNQLKLFAGVDHE